MKKDNSQKFGNAEIHGIEYYSYKNKEWKYTKIKDLRCLAVLGYGCNDLNRWNTGHNLSVIFGRDQEEAYEDIVSVFGFKNSSEYLPLPVYLCGKNNVKIPTLCAESNSWMQLEDYNKETSCIFLYLPAMTFDNTYDKNEYNHSAYNYFNNKE